MESDIAPDRTPKTTHQSSHHNRVKLKMKDGSHGEKSKSIFELSIFLAAIATGTACSILSKVLYGLQGVGLNGQLQFFDKPLFQTTAMFAAMVVGLPAHWIVTWLKLSSFPGYEHLQQRENDDEIPVVNLITSSMRSSEERLKLLHPRPPPTENTKDEDVPPNENTKISSNPEKYYGLPLDYPCGEAVASSWRSDRSKSVTTRTSEPEQLSNNQHIPLATYLILALLSVFDLTATALCAIGLLYLDVSVYQMLRGSGIIFVALLRQYGLRQRLYSFQWVGVLYNVLSVVLVGTAAIRDATTSEHHKQRGANVFMGVVFMLLGTLVQAMQFVLEEKLMKYDTIKVPPLLLFGMEGFWGLLFSLSVLYPIGFFLPGHDNGGHYEDFFNDFVMVWNSSTLQFFVALYMLSIFGYNLFAVLVTFSLSSIWHSILDNFRPMTVWGTDLLLYYVTIGGFGEAWTTNSWIELAGLFVLLYGTAVYNAPDRGSIQLEGQWYALGLNFDQQYADIVMDSAGGSSSRVMSIGSFPSLHRFMNTEGGNREETVMLNV